MQPARQRTRFETTAVLGDALQIAINGPTSAGLAVFTVDAPNSD